MPISSRPIHELSISLTPWLIVIYLTGQFHLQHATGALVNVCASFCTWFSDSEDQSFCKVTFFITDLLNKNDK